MSDLADSLGLRPSAIRPALTLSASAILGKVAWLMMESEWHRLRRVDDFARLVMPPIQLRQFRLFHDGDIPIAFLTWALFSPEAEERFIDDPLSLKPEDWTGGKAAYIVDFVVAKGAMRKIAPHLRRDPLIEAGPVRGSKMRNGMRVRIEVSVDGAGRHIRAARLDRTSPQKIQEIGA
jgi:hemolysin-activating ACP:hemolysin acyltransferase